MTPSAAARMRKIKRVAVLGGGVIGAGWAARFLLNGIDVAVADPAPQVEKRLRQVVDNARRAVRKLNAAPMAREGRLQFAESVAAAVEGADFVQESGPERLDLKQALLGEACQHTAESVVVASSTSGLLPSDLQAAARFPQRVIVGHPFNPVYLMPLVEIVGGRQTSPMARQAAGDFYQNIGLHPLQVRKEIEAFLADRMMEALWREALHLVNEGVATVDEIDQAICYGPGLRWSFMGSFMVYRVAGGEGGFRHFMAQFGPSLKWPWTRFDGPDMSAELLDKLARQSDHQAGDSSIHELEMQRDECLVAVLQALRATGYAAGNTQRNYEKKLYAEARASDIASGLAASASDLDISQPLALHRDVVAPQWLDYNNHMTESRYLQAFGEATEALFCYLGVDADYRAAGHSYYSVQTHLNFCREAGAGQPFRITTQLLGGDEKRLHLCHVMYAGGESSTSEGEIIATAEQILLHVNTAQGRACKARPPITTRLTSLIVAHAKLPRPSPARGFPPNGTLTRQF